MVISYLITKETERGMLNKYFANDASIKRYLDSLSQSAKDISASWDNSLICGKLRVERKNTDGGLRYLWFEEKRDEICIYVLRRIYRHDEYETKINSTKAQKWIEKHDYTEKEKEEIEAEFERLTPKEEKREILPEYLNPYEDRPRGFEKGTGRIIYELQEWVDSYFDYKDQIDGTMKQAIHQSLYNYLNEPRFFTESKANGVDQDSYGFLYLPIKNDKANLEIVFRLDANNNGDTLGVYLLQIVERSKREQVAKTLADHNYNCENVADLCSKTIKCYPDYILIEADTWYGIENDKLANLALSKEEENILRDIEYPFFVSGLAGSGKSTILYYLFAHAFNYAYGKNYILGSNKDQIKLLFLSYSDKLIVNAKTIVKAILKHHSKFLKKDDFEAFAKEFDLFFEKTFVPFQHFIKREFLQTSEEYELFSEDKYVNYEGFKRLYENCKMPEKKRYTADIVWSVIRTFIKGRKTVGYFTPEDYDSELLVSKDKTVTAEDYKNIYKIWNSWYRGYNDRGEKWDDLDLIRYAYKKAEHQDYFHQYSIIFCDEAQDFTRLETNFIVNLSAHSKYDLTCRDGADKIPIAFAGDPNQTINPTGFRWGSVKDIFSDAFAESLNKFNALNERMLNTNYRSCKGIVKFANTIQSLRQRLIDTNTQSKALQEAWDKTETEDQQSYVAFYSLEDYSKEINDGLNKAQAIITADEGDYAMDDSTNGDAYDPYVEYTIRRKEELGIPTSVTNDRLYTAITSKGLEFRSVILYKFSSDKAMLLFCKLINNETINESERYQLSHFFTKLYIAVSRAKRVLFVVDTKESYNTFWKYFVEDGCWASFVERINALAIKDQLGRLMNGNIKGYVVRLDENYNPKDFAEGLFKNALDECSADTMLRAQSAFNEAKMPNMANECKAYVLKFSKKYKQAGQRFAEIQGKEQEVIDCYWIGKEWKDFLTYISNHTLLRVSQDKKIR